MTDRYQPLLFERNVFDMREADVPTVTINRRLSMELPQLRAGCLRLLNEERFMSTTTGII